MVSEVAVFPRSVNFINIIQVELDIFLYAIYIHQKSTENGKMKNKNSLTKTKNQHQNENLLKANNS